MFPGLKVIYLYSVIISLKKIIKTSFEKIIISIYYLDVYININFEIARVVRDSNVSEVEISSSN